MGYSVGVGVISILRAGPLRKSREPTSALSHAIYKLDGKILSSMFRNRFEVINSLLPMRPKMLSDCAPNIIADFLVQV